MRAHRKRCGLSQPEFAALAGTSPTSVCRYERAERLPDMRTLIAAEVVFGVPLRQFAKRLYREIEHATRKEADKLRELAAAEKGKSSRIRAVKLETLERISASARAHADEIPS